LKWSWKRLEIKLRVITREGNGPHIYKPLHAVSMQEVEEGFQRPRGMPDGENCRWLVRITLAHTVPLQVSRAQGTVRSVASEFFRSDVGVVHSRFAEHPV
jgi:hypothetical protein